MEKNYKLSKYNYFFKVDNEDYIYNTFSGGLAKLEIGKKQQLINFKKHSGELDDFYQSAIKNGFIVEEIIDETAILNFNRSNIICQDQQSVYEILPTTACNARCFYCFEEGIIAKIMSIKTADKICDFIINSTPRKKGVLIQWFGGEPLLNPKVITYITQKLDETLGKQGVSIKYQMTTNGSLINDEIVKLMKNVWNISKIQITLDGTKEIYESRKAYINLPNAFDKVIKNINLLANNGISVAIRLNYDKNNISDILNLIDYLGSAIQNKQNVVCYGYPLFGIEGSISPDNYENAIQIIKITKKVIQNDLSHGNNTFNLHFVTSKCYACLRNAFLITPEGKLAKCSMAMDDKNIIGDVFSPIKLTNNYLKWCSTELASQECYSCKFLPLCQGGCKAGHLGFSPVKHYIYKNCFDEILTEIVNSKK